MRLGIPTLLFALNVASLASVQPTISTYAGGGPVNGPALSMNLSPQLMAATANGDVYFASSNAVYKLSGGMVILIAGTPDIGGFNGDGRPAIGATLSGPNGVALDGNGNVYIADSGNYRVRKVSADTDVISTVAGNGSTGSRGDDGLAVLASLLNLSSIAVDVNANLYILDTANYRVRKVWADTGVITTVAGNGSHGFSGDGAPATDASLSSPRAVAVDGDGNLYIADAGNYRIRKISAATGVITTVAGNGTTSYTGNIGDDGSATDASLNSPNALAIDSSGSLYIADGNRIRKVSADGGIITTVAGNGSYGFSGDGGPATSAGLSSVSGVAVDGSGSFYISGQGNRIRGVSADTGIITTVAGNGSYDFSGDGGPAAIASLSSSSGIAVDGSGTLYIADKGNSRIRKVAPDTGLITTVAGNGSNGFGGDGGPATSASLSSPSGVAADGSGNLFFVDNSSCGRGGCYSIRIREVSADTGVITTVAGNGIKGFTGDGGPAAAASLSPVNGVALDGNGNLYIADGNRVRKVSADTGVITTVAGNGAYGYSGPATRASFSSVRGVAADGNGNVYITDGNRIRKVSADTGVITTVAGNDSFGYSGDGGPATDASLNNPSALAVDGAGNIYIADSDNQRIREVLAATGTITTVAGDGSYGFGGDGGPAVSAWLASPSGMAVDRSRNIYIADSNNNRVRKVDCRTPTATLLTANANATTTQNFVLTATMTPADATGFVQFFDGTTTLGRVELSAGTATLSDLALPVGTHSFVGVYSGDTNHALSTSPPIVQVISSQANTALTLTADAEPIEVYGRTVYVSALTSPVTLTAVLTSAEATGTVQFLAGAASLGAEAVSGGTATFTTSSLPAGTHSITAVYSGDTLFTPRTAKAITLQGQDATIQPDAVSADR